MSARFKMTAALASLAVVAGLLRCLWLWQPERQVRLHQEHLLRAVEDRNWGWIEATMDARFADRWGHDRSSAVKAGRQWLGQFFALSISASSETMAMTEGGGTVSEGLAFHGTGTATAQMAEQAINGVRAPFVFQWRQASWRPWDWMLLRVDNAELEIPAGEM